MKACTFLLVSGLIAALSSMPGRGLASDKTVPLWIKSIPNCTQDDVRIGAGSGDDAMLGPMYILRDYRVIQEVDLRSWATKCNVVISKPVEPPDQCTKINVIGDDAVLWVQEVTSYAGAARYLWVSTKDTAGNLLQIIPGAPLTPESDPKRPKLAKWMKAPIVEIGGKKYDIFLYFVQEDPSDPYTIGKHYRLEIFDRDDKKCLLSEPEESGNLVGYAQGFNPKPKWKQTDVGEGKEKHP